MDYYYKKKKESMNIKDENIFVFITGIIKKDIKRKNNRCGIFYYF